MEETNKLTTQEFWSAETQGFYFRKHDSDHAINRFIGQFIPASDSGSCLEIGSYPGPFLASMGELGYTLNGIDFHADNAIGLPAWLQQQGYRTGKFWNSDFFDFDPATQFDLVSSFGFIEHFNDYEAVVSRHAALVKPGGHLLITTPNFRGAVQHWLHKRFDPENLSMHNVNSMQPAVWAELLKKEGFDVLFAGYFGGFSFWKGSPRLRPFDRVAIRWIERAIPYLSKLLWFQSQTFSAYCGIVARKRPLTAISPA
jgi:2-polyprenyl-3-methyl-5-hydroxy-6-metoxy-1,4-benzoquinol methylase